MCAAREAIHRRGAQARLRAGLVMCVEVHGNCVMAQLRCRARVRLAGRRFLVVPATGGNRKVEEERDHSDENATGPPRRPDNRLARISAQSSSLTFLKPTWVTR